MMFEAVSATLAADAIRRDLSLGLCPTADCRFEVVRAAVWSLAAPTAQVHVNRVLSFALPVWQCLSPRADAGLEALRAELRSTLTTLADTGDLLELAGGYWAPATARLIALPDRAGYLVVGGVPTSLLTTAHDVIQVHGPHRHLDSPNSVQPLVLPIETLVSWARLPSESLQTWAEHLLHSFARSPYSAATNDAFEFYRPATARSSTPQSKRWLEDAGSTTGTLLARRRRVYGAWEPRLVDVSDGRIVGICEMDALDVRRLMYAFDLAAGTPVRARQLRAGAQPEWLFTSALPRPEQRTLAAFGTLTIPEDRPWERRWTLVRNAPIALEMIRQLGIVLEPLHGDTSR